jgi:hypothetical protein
MDTITDAAQFVASLASGLTVDEAAAILATDPDLARMVDLLHQITDEQLDRTRRGPRFKRRPRGR